MKNTCSKCGINQRRAIGQKYCRECHNEYQRNNRPKHSELTPEQRFKANSRAYANVYKNRGKLEQQPCDNCGHENAEMHHDDYTKPLDVEWLCRGCHLELHNSLESIA